MYVFCFGCFCTFPDGSSGKESACNARDRASIPGSGRSPEVGNGNPLWYSSLGNSVDRGAWWAAVHGVAKLDKTEATEQTQTHMHSFGQETHTHTHTLIHTPIHIHSGRKSSPDPS